MPAHAFHPTLLREYDIRGIVGTTLHAADARAIGQAFGTMVVAAGGRKVVLGYDGRLSSPELAAATCAGFMAAGLEVLQIGMGPTPMMYFAVHHLGADGGLQITGSHNPPDYNGFKMMLGTKPFYGVQIQQIGQIAGDRRLRRRARAGRPGSTCSRPISTGWSRTFTAHRPLSVVWDAGNGAAGPAMEALAARLPGRHKCLFAEVDGNFPNHHPDPTEPHNLEALIHEVTTGGYELGIGFDGDGDRIGVVDGKGRIVFGDQILQILAADVLARHPGATIIADVKTSQTFFDEVARLGGEPLMWKTGHSLIKAKMAEVAAPLSGEMSGHIFFKDGFYGHDDALYVAVRLLDILARGTATMADLKDAMPVAYNTPEVRFDCPEERKFTAIAEVKANLAREGAQLDDIDGVRVKTEDGWWLARASNTQAVLVVRAEAGSPEGLERLKGVVRRQLDRVGIDAPEGF